MSPRRVLVTGAGGFIGRHVVAELERDGVHPVAVEHRWRDAGDLADRVGQHGLDGCIHLGWYARPDDYLVSVPGNADSLLRSLELVEVLGAVGCPRLVVAGSCAEYGPATEEVPVVEDHVVDPWSVYGAAKASLRLLLRSSLRPAGMRVAWARLFNVTGPGEDPRRLLPTAARTVADGGTLELTSGEQWRDYLDVADVATALIALWREGVDGDVNVCSGHAVRLRTLLEEVAAAVGGPGRLAFGARPHPQHEVWYQVGDPTRLRSTGWLPAHDRPAMIERLVRAGMGWEGK